MTVKRGKKITFPRLKLNPFVFLSHSLNNKHETSFFFFELSCYEINVTRFQFSFIATTHSLYFSKDKKKNNGGYKHTKNLDILQCLSRFLIIRLTYKSLKTLANVRNDHSSVFVRFFFHFLSAWVRWSPSIYSVFFCRVVSSMRIKRINSSLSCILFLSLFIPFFFLMS